MTCSRSSTRSRSAETSARWRSLVTEEMVETLAVRGTPEQCAADLERRFGDVADRVCAYFPGHDPGTEQIASLARLLAGGAATTGPG